MAPLRQIVVASICPFRRDARAVTTTPIFYADPLILTRFSAAPLRTSLESKLDAKIYVISTSCSARFKISVKSEIICTGLKRRAEQEVINLNVFLFPRTDRTFTISLLFSDIPVQMWIPQRISNYSTLIISLLISEFS